MLIEGRYYSETELISLFKKMQKQTAELTSECVRLKNVASMNSESQKIADGVIEELKQENAELKEKNMMLELDLGEVNEVIGDSMKAISENQKLKTMLKIVAKDISSFNADFINTCRLPCEKCLFYNDGEDGCLYKHMDEIKKLISDK